MKTASGAGRRSGRWRVRTAGCGLRRSLGDSDEITLWTWDRSVSDELVARAETKGIP
jgi:cellobiose transport system substrate-binding protein